MKIVKAITCIAAFVSIPLGSAAVLYPVTAAAQFSVVQDESPQARIRAVPLPPQGKECADESEDVERSRRLALHKRTEAFREASVWTIRMAEEVSDTYWDEQEADFITQVRGGADWGALSRPVGQKTDSSKRMAWNILSDMAGHIDCDDAGCPEQSQLDVPGQDPSLATMPRRICVALASRSSDFCREVGLLEAAGITAQAPEAVSSLLPDMCGFIEHAYKLDSWDDHSRCDALKGWQRTMCQRWFETNEERNTPRGNELCAGFGGMEYFACSLFVATVQEDLPYCGENLNSVACMFSLMWWSIGGREGEAGCERLRAVKSASSAAHERLYLQCKAVMRGEPSACPRVGSVQPAAPGAVGVNVQAMLRGGSRGVQPVITVMADTPSACAVSLEIVGPGAHPEQVLGVQTSSQTLQKVLGTPLSSDVEPFQQRVGIQSACVPMVDWGRGK